jgi:hypothetical protein
MHFRTPFMAAVLPRLFCFLFSLLLYPPFLLLPLPILFFVDALLESCFSWECSLCSEFWKMHLMDETTSSEAAPLWCSLMVVKTSSRQAHSVIRKVNRENIRLPLLT